VVGGRAIVGSILAGVIAACGANDVASPTLDATPTGADAVATASPTATTSPGPTNSPRSINPSPDQQPDPTPAPIPVPPKPTGVKFDEQRGVGSDPSMTEITQTITWGAPRSPEVEIRVYGVIECIAMPTAPDPNTSGPCLVTGTPLPASARTLLAIAPASDGTVSWTWTGTFDCGEPDPAYDPDGPIYRAVVLAAYNGSGHSIFAIAAPGSWWEPGPNDIVC
jgi:hypothetical protein